MKYYIIGLGGRGLRSIAEYLLDLGDAVWGFEFPENMIFIPPRLQSIIRCHENILVDCVIYSDGMKPSWKEHWKIYQYFLNQNIQCISRQDFILKILALSNESIAITGTCGKSSTTALLIYLFQQQKKDLSFLCGAELKNTRRCGQRGSFSLFLYECDESQEIFSHAHNDFGIITNLYYDHLENYHGDKKIQEKFIFQWMKNIHKLLIINGDDDFLFQHKTQQTVSIGFKYRNDVQIKKLTSSSFLYQGQIIKMSPYLEGEQYMFNYASALYFFEYFLYVRFYNFSEMKGIKNRMEKYRDSSNIYFIDNGHQPISIWKTIIYLHETYKDYKKILYFWPKPYYFHHESYEFCFQFIDKLIIIDNDNFYQHVQSFYPNVVFIDKFRENELEKNSVILFGGLCYINHTIQEFLEKTVNF